VGVLNLDSQPTQEAIDQLMAIDAIEKVQVIDLPEANDLPSWLQ